ncbi:glycosyltransferase family 2 protein [Tessaracoccus sp. Y1736]
MIRRHYARDRRILAARIEGTMDQVRAPASHVFSNLTGVWGVTVVRNEEELLPALLAHYERQALDGLVVADNLSTDRTSAILANYDGPLRLLVYRDHEPRHYHEIKMDFLAQQAALLGARWIVPMDADEFWYAPHGRPLGGFLNSLPSGIKVQSAHVHNVVRKGSAYFMGSMPDRLPKVAYRWHPWAHIHHGNHAVDRTGAIAHDLRILHFSYRSKAHFIRKIRDGAAALSYLGPYDLEHPGHSWLDLNQLDDVELSRTYDEMLDGRGPWFMDWIPKGDMIAVAPFPWRRWQLD